MKKVSVITLQNIKNYGSVLQALATQKVFEDIGCTVDFYNYRRPNESSVGKRIKTWVRGQPFLKKIAMGIVLFPSFIKQKFIFEGFVRKYLHQQKNVVSSIEDFEKCTFDADIFCTGSDQTWNSNWNGGVLPEMFLTFAPASAKKIAYAASMGKSKLDDYEVDSLRRYLRAYSAISVRESSAVCIVKEQLGIPAVSQVLDPTLQVSREFWLSLLTKKQKESKSKGRYVLLYQLNTNKEMDNYAATFAKKKNWKLVRFCTRYDQIFKCGQSAVIPKVTDFIALIANAGCVITDSFHASAFSCNMNVPMISIYPKEFGGRLASLLQKFHIEHRHLCDYRDFSFVENTEVDFTLVNEILEQERLIGWNFLQKAIL